MTATTYSVTVAESDAQALVDRLNAPRQPEEDGVDPGLGRNTCPEDATDLPGMTGVRKGAEKGGPPDHANAAITHRWFTLPVRPDDETRFRQIVDDVTSAERKTWHPKGRGRPNVRRPHEHLEAHELKRKVKALSRGPSDDAKRKS